MFYLYSVFFIHSKVPEFFHVLFTVVVVGCFFFFFVLQIKVSVVSLLSLLFFSRLNFFGLTFSRKLSINQCAKLQTILSKTKNWPKIQHKTVMLIALGPSITVQYLWFRARRFGVILTPLSREKISL